MDKPKDETSGLVCLHTSLIMAPFFLITAKSKGFNPSLFLIDKFSSLPNLPNRIWVTGKWFPKMPKLASPQLWSWKKLN
jgi:hypothetical protein